MKLNLLKQRRIIIFNMKSILFGMCALTLISVTNGFPAITKDIKIELPGTEKINRRSPEDYKNDSVLDSKEVSLINKRSSNYENEESMDVADNGLVFRPLFRTKERNNVKRTRRSVNEKDEKLNAAETGIVYVPLFRAKDKFNTKQRVRRSVLKDASGNVIRYPEDLQTSEDIVFKPLFRRKTRRTHYDDDDIFGSRLVFQNQYS